jgi:hypothetical protein
MTKVGHRTNEHALESASISATQEWGPKRIADIPGQDIGPVFREISCQHFFVQGVQVSSFIVNVPDQVQELVKTRPRGYADL